MLRCIIYLLAATWLSTEASVLQAANIAPQRFPVQCGRPGVFVPYASDGPIDQSNDKITRIIVGIHSSGFDAEKCLRALLLAASKVRGATESTLIVTPQFFDVNAIKQPIPQGLLAWKVSPYRGSSLACIGPQKEGIGFSAYDVMNQLLPAVANLERFRNLKTVVVCGHSAGGQMTQRYAITSKFRPPKGVSVRFVASGASSFAYLDSKRPRQQGQEIVFEELPSEFLEKYPNYNNWGYGLDARYRAFRRASDDYLRQRYAKRRVLYLCGSEDNNPNDSTLSKAYGALLQGRQRLERMKLFFAHLIDVYGEDIKKTHAMAIAEGVNHNGFDAYASNAGLKFLFDHSHTDTDKDGETDWEEWLAGTE
ncbi:alpha/beta hydrolase [Thalassoroseus pseudoceratinae]|uniref:alpha/beta hydrolase n=1 Tax=Thalassoroseus pseudoceratinae TaxID=2713176 RepID=UPI00141E4868|nr:alpha/beta hydrolase [Thalassoroseus pseudoceratinae]